tara:strand:+ start:419 stop:694 length:276 start_codon:yes stop_codon:yes gene_type:complete
LLVIFNLAQEELVKILLPSALADLVADLLTKGQVELEMQVVIAHPKEMMVEILAEEIMAAEAAVELAVPVQTQAQELLVAVALVVTEQQIQ